MRDLTGHAVYLIVIGLLLTASVIALRLTRASAASQERGSPVLRIALGAQCGCLVLILLLVFWQVVAAS